MMEDPQIERLEDGTYRLVKADGSTRDLPAGISPADLTDQVRDFFGLQEPESDPPALDLAEPLDLADAGQLVDQAAPLDLVAPPQVTPGRFAGILQVFRRRRRGS